MSDEMREPRDANHIWLRQSVTFTVNGQTRTVEMALPLRPGATPGEVEALLDEADAGMRRLSRRLDAHLAELLAPSATAASAPVGRPSASPEQSAVATPAAAPEAARPPARPAPRPPAAPQPAAPQPAPTGPDLTIPEFITQASALGFDSKRAMEKLGVRSLSGLNLREALESLRRQAVLDGASPTPTNPTTPNTTPASAPLLAFEEEEDREAFTDEPEMELSYPDPAELPDDDAEEEEDFLAEESAAQSIAQPPSPTPAPDLSALRRDTRLTSASKLPTPAPRRSGPLSQDAGIAETPAPPITPTPEPAPTETPAQQAERMLAELRATHGGGTPVAHQRTAFKNVVVEQLHGEKGAAALTGAIWNLTPDKLGPEQMDALTQWGKRDDFVEEAREVLRAAKRIGAQPPAPQPQEAPAAQEPTAPPARGARSTRQRPASQAEEQRGDH